MNIGRCRHVLSGHRSQRKVISAKIEVVEFVTRVAGGVAEWDHADKFSGSSLCGRTSHEAVVRYGVTGIPPPISQKANL